MFAKLTGPERQGAFLILGAVGALGLALALSAKTDTLEFHGLLVAAIAIVLFFLLIPQSFAPEPGPERLAEYFDDPGKAAILFSLFWLLAALTVGDLIAWQLAFPELTFGEGWSSYGRLRPVHTSGVVFGFGGNALLATAFHVVQRTSRARLPDQLTPWFVVLGYNLFCVVAATGYVIGLTQSKEYAEPEWYADLWLVVVWVAFLLVFVRTLMRRHEPHIYVANWYYLAFILVVAVLHIVNNLALVAVGTPVTRRHRGRDAGFPAPPAQIRTGPPGHPAPAFGQTSE